MSQNFSLKIYRLKGFTINSVPSPTKKCKKYVEQHTKRQVYKNVKAHNVYHRCLCFIFDQTTMAQEQESLFYYDLSSVNRTKGTPR